MTLDDVISISKEADRLQARRPTYSTLVKALLDACDLIADYQRDGCPAGVVAIPSRIADVLRAAA